MVLTMCCCVGQWWVDSKQMAADALAAASDGRLTILPKMHNKKWEVAFPPPLSPLPRQHVCGSTHVSCFPHSSLRSCLDCAVPTYSCPFSTAWSLWRRHKPSSPLAAFIMSRSTSPSRRVSYASPLTCILCSLHPKNTHNQQDRTGWGTSGTGAFRVSSGGATASPRTTSCSQARSA